MRCPTPRNGHNCNCRRCPECGLTWAGDTRRKLFENFGSYTGQVAMIAVTAPGVDQLPWDTSCSHPGPCSGTKGCKLDREAARAWNSTASARWSEMHRTASQWTRRRYPKQLDVLGRVWEYQKRGALHVHVVVGLETPIKRHAAIAYQQRLAEIAPGYGFGFVQQKMSSARGQNAAAYVSSYFIEGHGRKASIRETVTSVDVPPHVVHVSTALTTATGVTMRSLRRVRYLYAIRKSYERGDLVVDLDTGELVPPRPTRYVLRT